MKSLTENIRSFSHGTEPLVDAIADVNFKPEMAGNSWFWVGHFDAEGHTLNFMYHISVLSFSKCIPFHMINSVLSITDETGKIYRHEDRFYRPKSGQVAKDGLSIHTDRDVVEGDLGRLHIASTMSSGAIDVTMHGTGYPLYSLCTGYFQLAGAPNYQYSFPPWKGKAR